ncbi:MAG: hypothetical protein MUC31_04720, partial [Bacteroidales bacterium]|nr:hypothetical protein [Bacteroidales bacterium]
ACDDGFIRFLKGKGTQLMQEEFFIAANPCKLLNDNEEHKMYFHLPVNTSSSASPMTLYEEQMMIYDEENINLQNVGTHSFETMLWYYIHEDIPLPHQNLVFDSGNDKIYIANGHSQINEIRNESGCENYPYANYIFQSGSNIIWTEDKYIEKSIILESGSQWTELMKLPVLAGVN